MTALRELETRLLKLQDVREILVSMKNLAYLETRKLEHRLEAQRQSAELIERAATELLEHYPELRPGMPPFAVTAIIIGSERGFCGSFNDRLLAEVEQSGAEKLVSVGRKLTQRLEGDTRVSASIDGASITEEAEAVLDRLVKAVESRGAMALIAVFHDVEEGVRRMPLLPPFTGLAKIASVTSPPVLNLAPDKLFIELTDQYLYAALQLALLSSLLAENLSRVQHLEGAVQHLDEQLVNLEHRRHQLRQEEIIEEIEVILLNATDPDRPLSSQS